MALFLRAQKGALNAIARDRNPATVEKLMLLQAATPAPGPGS